MDVMTVGEVAKYLKVRKETILKMIKRGDLKATKIGRIWRLNKSDVDKFMGKDN